MAKLPAIQFYPGDWLQDSIAGCSLAAQGLWLRMMFVAHNSDRYGYLMLDGKPLSPEAIARRCGCSLEQYLPLLSELDEASIPSRTKAGVIFSRRMVRDAETRAANRMYQYKFRNSLQTQDNSKTDVRPMSDVSSTSTSTTKLNTKTKATPAAFPLPEWVPLDSWEGFVAMRQKIRAPLTDRAKQGIVKDLERLRVEGFEPGAVLFQSEKLNWRGVFRIRDNGGNYGTSGGSSANKSQQRTDANKVAAGRALEVLLGATPGTGGDAPEHPERRDPERVRTGTGGL